jgi:hypothetical protein
MTHPNRYDSGSRSTEPGILSNVFSFVSREIGEFVISATGGAGEVCSVLSTRTEKLTTTGHSLVHPNENEDVIAG